MLGAAPNRYDVICLVYVCEDNVRLHHFIITFAQVMFKKLIFHLESPAGLIFPKVSNPDPLRCRNTGLFHAYRKHILEVCV